MAFAAITAYGCLWAIQINTECSKAIVMIHNYTSYIYVVFLMNYDITTEFFQGFSSYWRLEGYPTPWSHTSGQH